MVENDHRALEESFWHGREVCPNDMVPGIGEDQHHIENGHGPEGASPPPGEPRSALGEVEGKGQKQGRHGAGANGFKRGPKNGAVNRGAGCADGRCAGVGCDRHHEASKRACGGGTLSPNPCGKGDTA